MLCVVGPFASWTEIIACRAYLIMCCVWAGEFTAVMDRVVQCPASNQAGRRALLGNLELRRRVPKSFPDTEIRPPKVEADHNLYDNCQAEFKWAEPFRDFANYCRGTLPIPVAPVGCGPTERSDESQATSGPASANGAANSRSTRPRQQHNYRSMNSGVASRVQEAREIRWWGISEGELAEGLRGNVNAMPMATLLYGCPNHGKDYVDAQGGRLKRKLNAIRCDATISTEDQPYDARTTEDCFADTTWARRARDITYGRRGASARTPRFSWSRVKAISDTDIAAVRDNRGLPLPIKGCRMAREILYCPRTDRVGWRPRWCSCEKCLQKLWDECPYKEWSGGIRWQWVWDVSWRHVSRERAAASSGASNAAASVGDQFQNAEHVQCRACDAWMAAPQQCEQMKCVGCSKVVTPADCRRPECDSESSESDDSDAEQE
eukprot:COSAG01_NODE_5680_length_4104_cov_10.613233_1_plen_435_part_00